MIQFILNDKIIKTSEKSGLVLIDFIREHQQLKGTKIGCREGDCGACTVLIGTLLDNKITYQSITSCISPLGNANGKHIVTIEGLNLKDKLNIAQEEMANNYATQCGFCTPGFVVSMTGHTLKSQESKSSCEDAISGNICRCTGYKSIEKASNSFEERLNSVEKFSIQSLIEQGFIPEYFNDIPHKLKSLNISVSLPKISTAKVVANGTDLYVHNAESLSEEDVYLVGNDILLKGITFNGNKCTIGASTTVTEILENETLLVKFKKLNKFLKLVSSEQIRNMGTLGGNFVNASPIGDMSIFFLALNSELTIKSENSSRTIPFESFHQDYKKYDLKNGELIQFISFELPQENSSFNFEKVSKRTHLDIASVNSACKIDLENNLISEAYLSIGGVSAIPKMLIKTNEYLLGKQISIETIKSAEEILQTEISPLSDIRGTKEYKRLLARQLFFAHFIELFPTITLKNLLK